MAQADVRDTSNTWGGFIDMPQQHIIQIVLLGIVLGILQWILTVLLRQVVLIPLFCGDPTNGACLNVDSLASNVAGVIVAFIGLLGLIRLSVYRPLVIALAVLVSLWGIGAWTSGLQWYETLAWDILLYGIGYVAFAWLVRPRSFTPAIIAVVVAVVLIRLIPIL